MTDRPPCLIVLSGLPGTGKTATARELVRRCRAIHLRIDTIEAALKRSVLHVHPAEDAGYVAAYGVAADNLVGEAASTAPVAAARRIIERLNENPPPARRTRRHA